MTPLGLFIADEMPMTSYFCEHNQFIQELLNASSPIYTNANIKILFLHLDGEELLKDAYYSLSDHESATDLLNTTLRALSQFLERRRDITIFLSSILFPPFHFTTYIKKNSFLNYGALELNINNQLNLFANEFENVLLFDFKRIVLLHGYNQLFDERFWYLGRIRYNSLCFELLAKELHNYIKAYTGSAKKVLVLDLDNTLWGGIIGEDGIGHLALSEDREGKIYRDLQKSFFSLKSLGILFAINSKNNPEDAQEVFDKHPMMIFKYDDFVAKKINWENKAANLIAISEELNLGLDSFVFIDDNPTERKLIKTALPEVTVPEMPQDKSNFKKWFLSEVIYQYFSKTNISIEDSNKTDQYKKNAKRQILKSQLSIDEFILGLNIRLHLRKNEPSLKNRIAQLTQKTNQFNLRSVRYTVNDIDLFIHDTNIHIYGLSYEDAFGDEGVIGVAIVKFTDGRYFIDTFLLSCRVLGRNVEYSFMDAIAGDLLKNNHQAQDLFAEYIKSDKNVIASDFYQNCGFINARENIWEGSLVRVKSLISKKIIKGAFEHE